MDVKTHLSIRNIISVSICIGLIIERGRCQTTPTSPTVDCTSPGFCQNGGVCQSGNICQCQPGFKGDMCQTFACEAGTCQNGAECVNEFVYAEIGQICDCLVGFDGPYCETQVSPNCNMETCLNGGYCAPIVLGILCQCLGFTGTNCEQGTDCTTADYCKNGGTCSFGIEGLPSMCACPSGVTGDYCETFACDLTTCLNGGTCADQLEFEISGSICNCPLVNTGTYCEILTVESECNVETCLNEGFCASPELGTLCECQPGYMGTFCETMENCVNDPSICLNNGECVDGVCNCNFGFTGTSCEIFECSSGTCQNGASCQTSETTDPSMLCMCSLGYMGTFCEEVNPAEMCMINCRQGVCSSNHTCICDTGYRGTNCDLIITCDEEPCLNEGECVIDLPRRRRKRQLFPSESGCSCPISHTGAFCEMERPPCDIVCQNNGQCELHLEILEYYCECPRYYYGEFCENIDDCFEIGCESGGRCEENKCVCPEGRYGGFCEFDICETNPCENGGLCLLPIELFSEIQTPTNEFKCACPPGFRGLTCTGVIVECGRNEFACTSGECVPLSKRCDDVPYDCADNSDEPDGECNNKECGELLSNLDSMTLTCGDFSRANDFYPESRDLQHIFGFNSFSDFRDAPNIISMIRIYIDSFFGNDIVSDGTLFVALLPESTDIEPLVLYFKVLYEDGDGETRFEKNLTDIYNMGSDGEQLVSLSFLPDGSTDHVLLPVSRCLNQERTCMFLTTRMFIPSCTVEAACIERYGDWVRASDELRDYNCGVASIDSVVDSLYEQCLVAPVIASISSSSNVDLEDGVTLYCVAAGVPTPNVQWVELTTEDGEYVEIEEPSARQSVYKRTDISSTTTRYACLVENIANTLLSEDVVISIEDPSCADLYTSTRQFSLTAPACYNDTIASILPGSGYYSDNFTKGSVLYGASFSSSNIRIGSGFNEYEESSFTSSSASYFYYLVLSIEISISNLNTGVIIYTQMFDGIIIDLNQESETFQIELIFDQSIKINDTSEYTIRLSSFSDPEVQLLDEQLEIKGVTCENGSPECLQFLSDWNRLVSDQVDAGCGDIDVQYTALELCFGEFFGDPEVIRHPESQASDAGKTSTLQCNIENVEFYEWYKNEDLLRSSGPTYSVELNQGQDQGDYACFGFRSQDLKDAKSNSATVLITGVSTFRVLVRFNIPFEADYTDRESATFKNFTSELQALLEQELPPPFDLYITSLTSGSVITEMEIYFTNPAQNATTYSAMINDSLVSLSGYQTDHESIVVTSISSCIGEDVTESGIVYSFPDVPLGTTAESTQDCPLYSDQGMNVPMATRYCGGDFVSGAEWGAIMVGDCDIGTTSRQIQQLDEVEVTEDNGLDVADALVNVTSNTNDLDEESVMSVAGILKDIVGLEMADEMITLDVVEVVNNIIESGVLGTDPSMRETASSFVTSLERQLATIAAAGINFTSVQPYVGVMTLTVSSEALLNGLAYVAYSDGDSLKENFKPDDVRTFFQKAFPFEMVGASIALPPEIISISQDQTGEDEIRVYFTIYQNSSLFISNKLANESGDDFTRQVGSQIISASIEAVKINGLVTPIKSAFLPRSETSNNTECVFWDFTLDNGVGEWSSEGCTLDRTTDDRVICVCDHLTNFAILVDYYEPKDSTFQDVLTIISLIGCIVSIICLAITIITYLYFKQFRSKRPQRILINLSLSLLLLYLVFAIGIEQTSSKNGCIAVGALIHYFALASIFWMSIEAVNMYLMFVKVFYDDIRHFMLKVCLVGYGCPLIIVAVCLGIDLDHYANENYCFIPSGDVRNFGFILVIGVLLLFNCVVFVLVMRTLTCGRKVAKTIDQSRREQVLKRLQNAVAVSVLLGLTWVFGFLAIDSDSSSRDFFQLLFCISNSLQGLFIFLLFCVRQKDIRDAWKGCCKESDRAKRVKYATDTSNSKGKAKDHSIPLTNTTHSTNTGTRINEQV